MSSKQSQKGTRFEYLIRDKLTEATGVKWERAPSSGAGAIKGDLFCPTAFYHYCFECKSYADSVIQENLLTAKSNNFYSWWKQCVLQAQAMQKKPALVFKKDRGKHFIAVLEDIPELNRITINTELDGHYVDATIYLFDDWLEFMKEKICTVFSN